MRALTNTDLTTIVILLAVGQVVLNTLLLWILGGFERRVRRLERVSRVLIEAHPTHIGRED